MISKPGFYEMTAAEYHTDPCESPSLSSSVAWAIEPSNMSAGSPKHGQMMHPKLGGSGKQSTDAMRFGSICHAMMLGTGDAEFSLSPYDDYKTKVAREWRDAQIAAGKMPVKQPEMDAAKECVTAWSEQLKAFGLGEVIYKSRKECVIAWEDWGSIGKVWCRAMLDIFCDETGDIWDIKTTSSAHPKKVARKIVDEGLALRSEFYKRGVETLLPELKGRTKFGFLFCQTEAPYLVTPVLQLDGRFRFIGKAQVQRSIDTFAQCLKTNSWPGYVTAPIQSMEAPTWAFKEEIEESENDDAK